MKSALLLTISVLMLGVGVALPCSCPMPRPPCSEYSESDAVFVGTVIKSEFPDPDNTGLRKVVIKVNKNFKGASGTYIYVEQWLPGNSCSLGYEIGDKQLFYGSMVGEKTPFFSTNHCSRTRGFRVDLPDFGFLDSLNTTVPRYIISGTIGSMKGLPTKNIKVEIFKDTKPLAHGTSDSEGSIEFNVATAGKYVVRIWVPKNGGIAGYAEDLARIKRTGKKAGKQFAEIEVDVTANKCGGFSVPLGLVD